MSNFLASIVLASLLVPSGFNFLITRATDFPYAQVVNQQALTPVRMVNTSFGLETSADSIVVIDDESEAILYSKNSGTVTPIASITKLVTALTFLNTNPDLESSIVIESSDFREGGIARLIPGEEINLRDLLVITLTASANEGAVALARASGLEDFPAAMNNTANQLGMWRSYFVEPSGVDPANISRPADLIKLADTAFEHPEIKQALGHNTFTFTTLNTQRVGSLESTNELLTSFLNNNSDYQIVGAKTGYLDEAGYCLLFKVKKNNGPSLTVVILGADTPTDRWQEAKGLVDWVFSNYQWPNLAIENSAN